MQRLDLFGTFLAFLTLTFTAAAQVTVSGNGGSSTNGFTVTEGTNITAVSASETFWADSTDGRLKVTNHGASTQFDIGLWPCRLSVGGMVYGDALNGFNISPEKCLPIGASGQILTANGTAPSWSSTPTLGASGTTGTLSLVGSTSGTAVITPQAAAGTPTITLGTSSGTPAVTATSPLSITTATGNITCSTCVTSVTGTANQISSTGGTTPTLAITNPFIFPGKATLAASTTSAESLNIPSGTVPTSPVNGAVFYDGSTLYFNDGVASEPHPRIARLAADSAASTSTTPSSLTGMSFSLVANTNYTVVCDLFYTVYANTGGLAVTFTGPTGTNNVIFGGTVAISGSAPNNGVSSAFGTVVFTHTGTSGATYPAHVSGTIENGVNSGSLTLQYANVASGVGSVTVKRGTWCTVQ